MTADLQCHPEVAKSLKKWHQMVADKDLSALRSLLADEIVFRSPMAHTPYPGVEATATILGTVLQVFENFKYHRQLSSADGLSLVLEFSARVGTKALKGIDLIRFNTAGQIVEFEVMIRPMSGLQALGTQMAARLGASS